MKKTLIYLGTFLIAGLTSCTPKSYLQESMSKHSESLYTYKKAPSRRALDTHLATLQTIISDCQVRDKKVPPGIYAEYGFFLLDTHPQNAKKYLLRETELYPESTVFIHNFLHNLGLLDP